MVFLLVLLYFVGCVSASHRGWAAQYTKTTNTECNKLQQHFDREEFAAYKEFFDDVGKAQGNAFFDPNFVASKANDGTLLQLAQLGNPGISDTSAPRCQGVKFNSRVGYPYDPHSQDAGQIFKQRFCYEPKNGFSVIALQSGHQRVSEIIADGRTCFHFNLLNVEEIEIYTFSSALDGDYDFAIETFWQDTNSWEVKESHSIEGFFNGIVGHLTVKRTSVVGINSMQVEVGLDGLIDNAQFGEIGIKGARCRNTPSVNFDEFSGFINDETIDPILGDEDSLFRVMDGCGSKIQKDAIRPYLSKNSATAICKRQDGTCIQPLKGTVDYRTAASACSDSGQAMPDGTPGWFDDQCCDSLALEDDFGYDWLYAWTSDWRKMSEFKDIAEAENIDITDATAQAMSADELSAMSVEVLDAQGNNFQKDVYVGNPLNLELKYDRQCASLEVVFEFKPSHQSQEGFEGTKIFSIYQQPGYIINYAPFNVGISKEELNAMKYNVKNVNLEAAETYFRRYSDINFIAGDWQTPNFGFPSMVRNSNYHLSIRGTLYLRQDKNDVTFHVVASSGKVWLLWNGRFLINHDTKTIASNSSRETYTADQTVNLRGFIYNTIDLSYVHYGNPFGSELTQLTLLWTESGQTEVIPRKYFYNHGGDAQSGPSQLIISPTQHVTIDHNINPYSHFELTLDYDPGQDITVVCNAPEGLGIYPTQVSFSSSQWSEWHEMTVWQKPNYGNGEGPDEAIHCHWGDNEISFYVTVIPSYARKLLIQGITGWVSRYQREDNTWRLINIHSDSDTRYASMLSAQGSNQYSVNIQTKHDSVTGFFPVVGVVIQHGSVVFALYPTTTSSTPQPFHLNPLANIPLEEHPIITKTDTGYRFEAPSGLLCYIDIVAERFLDVSCDLPSYFNNQPQFPNADADSVPLANNLFFYPTQASHLLTSSLGPVWLLTPATRERIQKSDSLIGASAIGTPRTIQVLPLVNAHLGAAALEALNGIKEYPWDSRSVWNTIDREGYCPLLDGMYPMLFSLYLNFASSDYAEVMAETVAALYRQCSFAMYVTKIFSCFHPNYYFNENDARGSMRNILHHSMSFWMQQSARIPGNLVQAYENDGHFCNKDGHLVGTPPTCACIGNGVYPDCEDTSPCGPQTQWQLDHQNSVVTTWSVESTNPQFCNSEKSLVIEGTGVGMYCMKGFCTLWESVRSQKGLPLGVNPCDTPYCVVAVMTDPALPSGRKWVGLTECGSQVSSLDDGQSWSQDDVSLDASQPGLTLSSSISDVPSESEFGVTPPNFYPKWSWSNDEICVEDDSIGKPIEYCVKWICDCLDADIWSSLI